MWWSVSQRASSLILTVFCLLSLAAYRHFHHSHSLFLSSATLLPNLANIPSPVHHLSRTVHFFFLYLLTCIKVSCWARSGGREIRALAWTLGSCKGCSTNWIQSKQLWELIEPTTPRSLNLRRPLDSFMLLSHRLCNKDIRSDNCVNVSCPMHVKYI